MYAITFLHSYYMHHVRIPSPITKANAIQVEYSLEKSISYPGIENSSFFLQFIIVPSRESPGPRWKWSKSGEKNTWARLLFAAFVEISARRTYWAPGPRGNPPLSTPSRQVWVDNKLVSSPAEKLKTLHYNCHTQSGMSVSYAWVVHRLEIPYVYRHVGWHHPFNAGREWRWEANLRYFCVWAFELFVNRSLAKLTG